MIIKIDYKILSALLLVTNLLTLLIWQPWSANISTITVTGEAVVVDTPDEFLFTPNYQETGVNSLEAIEKVTAKGNSVVAGVIALGIEEKKITTSVSNYMDYKEDRIESSAGGETVAYFGLQIKVDNLEVAQRVLDYLVTTGPIYGVTPNYEFSDAKRSEIEKIAREKALEDARLRANQTAEQLGFKIRKVVSVSDLQPGTVAPFADATTSTESLASPKILTGEHEISYTVSVVFSYR